jgi:hypothetical protein
VEEPILIIEETDAAKCWWEDGSWRVIVGDGGRILERWRAGVASVVAAGALAGILVVGASPARWDDGSAARDEAAAAAASLAGENRAMSERVARLEETNRRLYAAIEATHYKLAEVEVMRAHLEANALPEETPSVQTADARLR